LRIGLSLLVTDAFSSPLTRPRHRGLLIMRLNKLIATTARLPSVAPQAAPAVIGYNYCA